MQLSLRASFFVVTACAVIAALTGRFGVPVGVFACAVFCFAMLMSWGASGEPQTCAGLLAPLVMLLTFGDYALPVFVDASSCLAACGLVGLACGPFLRQDGNRAVLIMAAAAALWLCSLTFINATPQKAFVRAFHRIHKGMTLEEVNSAIDSEFTKHSPRLSAREGGLTVILDPHDGRYNAEIIQLEMVDGRVVSKRYLAD